MNFVQFFCLKHLQEKCPTTDVIPEAMYIFVWCGLELMIEKLINLFLNFLDSSVWLSNITRQAHANNLIARPCTIKIFNELKPFTQDFGIYGKAN